MLSAVGIARPTHAEVQPSKSASAAPAPAVESRQLGSAAPAPAVESRRLGNGLRVVLAPDPGRPNVALCVTYQVGSRDEEPGSRGFAKLVERLMFDGSRNVAQGEHWVRVASHGGQTESSTSSELTRYCDALPPAELPLGLWLEAERMKTLALTLGTFEDQRRAALQELRTGLSSHDHGEGRRRLQELAFQGCLPCEHLPDGTPEDLQRATLPALQRFYLDHYVANNAVLSLVGPFDVEATMRLVESTFGAAPAQASSARAATPQPVQQHSERLVVLEDGTATSAGVYFGWVIPPAGSAEHYALELAASILGSGESALLRRALVSERGLARRVSLETTDEHGPSLFWGFVEVTPNASLDEVHKAVDQLLARLRVAGPTPDEVLRAKERLRTAWVLREQAALGRAADLGRFAVLCGEPAAAPRELERTLAVSAADIQRAVAKHLGASQRTLVEVYPPGALEDDRPPPQPLVHIIAPGESLLGIAKRHSMSVADLVATNRLRRNQTIFPGQKLVIVKPARSVRPPPTASARPPLATMGHGSVGAGAGKQRPPAGALPGPRRARVHVVRQGDTLSGIARRHGVRLADLAARNGIPTGRKLRLGQKLELPTAAPP